MLHLFHWQVISERDILGTQLIRRNDELALLYEKIKIQQSTLTKGECHITLGDPYYKSVSVRMRVICCVCIPVHTYTE